jgi:hypothetical protein
VLRELRVCHVSRGRNIAPSHFAEHRARQTHYNCAVRVPPKGAWLAVLLAASSAAAAPLSADITVQGDAESCPSSAELAAAVEQIVQRPLGAAGPSDTVTATVRFQRTDVGFQALLRLAGAKQGERSLTDTTESCAPLAQAVAVTLAVLIDADATPAARPVVSSPRSRGSLSLGVGPALGLVPSVSLAMGGEMAVGWRRWSVHVGGIYLLPREERLGPGDVQVHLAYADALLCRLIHLGASLEVEACGVGAAGWLSGTGEGYPSSSQAAFFWSSLGAALRLGGTLGGTWLWRLSTEALAPLAERSFSIGNLGVAYRTGRVGGLAQLQLGMRLW